MQTTARRLSLTLLAAPILLVAATARGQSGAAPKIRNDATTLILPAGCLPLKDVIDATATFLKVNIFSDKRELEAQDARIELQTALSLERSQVEATVSDLVYRTGFVLMPRNAEQGLYDLISMEGPRNREISNLAIKRTPEQIMANPTLKQPVTTVVKLQHINAVVASNAMRPFFASTGAPRGIALTLGTAGGDQSLVFSGIQADVAKAIELVRENDTEAAGAALPGDKTPAQLPLKLRVAELEQIVQQLQKELAEQKKRQADGK